MSSQTVQSTVRPKVAKLLAVSGLIPIVEDLKVTGDSSGITCLKLLWLCTTNIVSILQICLCYAGI